MRESQPSSAIAFFADVAASFADVARRIRATLARGAIAVLVGAAAAACRHAGLNGASRADAGSTIVAPSGRRSSDEPASAPDATPTADAPSRRADASPDEDAAAYGVGRPVRARSIGHTSYVLQIKLDNGLLAAFKPRSRLPRGRTRYRGEIAAYRLARALGLSNVPVAVPRTFAGRDVRAAFTTADAASEFDRQASIDRDGTVHGALMPWITHYEEIALETPEGRARWEPWLTDLSVPVADADRGLASAVSTMLVFDFVTGNWDRWSGGNVARNGDAGTLLFVDNDGAFYDPPPRAALSRQAAFLQRVVRYSRRFVTALRALDRGELGEAMGQDEPGQPLLPPRVLDRVEERRLQALAIIDSTVSRDGDAATFAFE